MKKISQREARRLAREVDSLNERIRAFVADGAIGRPSGTLVTSATWSEGQTLPQLLELSRRLGFAVVCTTDGQRVQFYAVKP